MTGEPPQIALEHVAKRYDGVTAIRDLTLTIPRGSFTALIGASGCGKTTTLKTINRLIEPDAGRVLIAGQPAAEQPPHLLRRSIGYVFQGIGLFPHLSVAENIGITPQLLGWPAPEISSRTAELLSLVQLPPSVAARRSSALSGGQAQRVAVARALAAKPAIMLMDEPFGALDPVTRATLGSDYRQIHDQLGLTTVMVTHDLIEALLLADRILVMRAGAIVADGTPRSLLAYRGDPEVEALLQGPRQQAARLAELGRGA